MEACQLFVMVHLSYTVPSLAFIFLEKLVSVLLLGHRNAAYFLYDCHHGTDPPEEQNTSLLTIGVIWVYLNFPHSLQCIAACHVYSYIDQP